MFILHCIFESANIRTLDHVFIYMKKSTIWILQRYTHISTKRSETTLCVLYECYLVTDRRVSCKDLGKGDCEGWLLKRKTKGTILPHSHWHRRWCVIKDYNLYCFHEREVSDEKFNKNKVFKIKPKLTQRQWNLNCVWSTMFITALSVV